MRSEAILQGSVLFIDGRVWSPELRIQEAADEIAEMSDIPNAPLWLYITIDPRQFHKNRRQSDLRLRF